MRRLPTHYENLKISHSATPEVVRAAYKVLSQKHHPDKNPPDERTECERIMRLLNEAYEVLSDPERKLVHDSWIESKLKLAEREPADATCEQQRGKDGEAKAPAGDDSTAPSNNEDIPDVDQVMKDLLNERWKYNAKVSTQATRGQRAALVYRLSMVIAIIAALLDFSKPAVWMLGFSTIIFCFANFLWRVLEIFRIETYNLSMFEHAKRGADKLISSAYRLGYNMLPDAGTWELSPAFMRNARIDSDIGPLSLKGKLMCFDIFPMYIALTSGKFWKETILISWDQVEFSTYKGTRALRSPEADLELQRVGYLHETKYQQPDLRYSKNPRRYFVTFYGMNLKLFGSLELEFEFGNRGDRSDLFTYFRSMKSEFNRSLVAEARHRNSS